MNSEKLKQKWNDPAYRQMMVESHKKAWENSEYRKRMSDAHKGNPGYWLGKKCPHSAGENNPGYIDGRHPEHKRQRHCMEIFEWRRKVFERDDYTCQICKIRGGKLNADHIKPFAFYPELRFELSNGRTLCVGCHRKTDTWGKGAYKFKPGLQNA